MDKKYRKKPVVIEAVQFTSDADYNEPDDGVFAWLDSNESDTYWYDDAEDQIVIDTLEGTMRADVGDWIIRGVQGKFYPIKDSIFRETYEEAGA